VATYFIRQGGHGAQGPFEEERIRGWIAQGRVRGEGGTAVSADGQLWIAVGEHPVFASAALPPLPSEPIEPIEEIPADLPRRSRRTAARPAPRSTGGANAAAVVIGLLVLGGIGYVVMGGPKSADQGGSAAPRTSTAGASPLVETPRPTLPVVATKREFRRRWEKYWDAHPEIGWRQPGIYGKTIDDAEAVHSAACSGRKPDRTQTIGGKHYWYFDCADGLIQLTWTYWEDNSGVRLNVHQLNDY
jgi:hypothetical protein